MTESKTICSACDSSLELIDLNALPRIPCPYCGGELRTIPGELADSTCALDSLRGRLKRQSLPSDKKLRWESFSGYQFSQSHQKMVHKVRTFDKDTDEYLERVTDPDTGQIIHECVEPLSKHISHGTAKKKQS